jgi:hypothetical protein
VYEICDATSELLREERESRELGASVGGIFWDMDWLVGDDFGAGVVVLSDPVRFMRFHSERDML